LHPFLDRIQVRASQWPGCIMAIAHRGKLVSEYAFGHANCFGRPQQLANKRSF
jgi:hypothetical protein